MRYRTAGVLLAASVCLLPLSATAGPGDPNDPSVTTSSYFIRQLTNNDTMERYPVISGNNVAWYSEGTQLGTPYIALRDPERFGVVTQVLASGNVGSAVDIWGNFVTYVRNDDILVADGEDPPVNITNTPNDKDTDPHIWGPMVSYISEEQGLRVWTDYTGSQAVPDGQHPGSVSLWGYEPLALVAAVYTNTSAVDEGHVWAYDLQTQVQSELTDPNYSWTVSHVDATGPQVVWSASYSENGPAFADEEIYAFDMSGSTPTYTQISQNDTRDIAPITNGENIVWIETLGGQTRLMLHQNGVNSAVFETGEIRDYAYDGVLAWTPGYDPADADYDFIVRHGDVDYDFTAHAAAYSLQVSGKNLTWHEHDGNDTEIWAAFFGGPEAVLTGIDLSLLDLGGLQLINGDLRFTSLRSALIEGTNFSGSDLTGASGLEYAIGQAIYSHRTILPDGFDAQAAGWSYVTPEPGALLLAVLGLFALGNCRRRQ